MYDIVIAGSGLGGLLCGYVLSKEGYKVCILEKHHVFGGCLQAFKRNNCIFDTGMHYVGSLDEGQIMWRFFKYFGLLDDVKIRKLDIDRFDLVHIAGHEYNYAQGHDNFVEKLLMDFPNERKALENYTAMLKQIQRATESFMENDVTSLDSVPTMKYFEQNANEFIQSLTSDYRLQNVLAATNSLHFGKSEKTSVYVHMVINNSLVESSYRFVDGGQQIADSLVKSIRNFGGTVLNNTEVSQFVMNSSDTQIEYAQLSNGEKVYGKTFISDIHPSRTFEMIESSRIRKAFIRRINSIEQTLGIFSVYCVLEEETFEYMNHNYYHCENENVWVADVYNQIEWPGGFMLYTPANSKSEKWADSITIMTFMDYEEVRKWEHTTVEKRGQEYKDFKQKKAETLLDFAEQRFPGLKSKIKAYYTSTPLTYRDYTGTVEGSTYGIMRDCNNALKTMITPRTKISNLHLTGQNINLHGVLGVTMGAFITLANFVGFNYMKDNINRV